MTIIISMYGVVPGLGKLPVAVLETITSRDFVFPQATAIPQPQGSIVTPRPHHLSLAAPKLLENLAVCMIQICKTQIET